MIEDLKRAAAFADIRERLGKLVPRLASEHPGEIVATVAAIGRTLVGAGLDWHDLAARLIAETLDDMIAAPARKPWPPEPAPKPAASTPSWSAEREAELQAARKPKREPSPWPTWGALSHFGKLAWMDAILRDGGLSAIDLEAFRAFHGPYYRNQEWTRKGANAFNRHVRTMWERGWRPEGRAA